MTRGTLPHPLLDLFTSNTAIHIHDTRHRHDPVSRASVSRSDLMTRSILYQGPKILSGTPSHIKKTRHHLILLNGKLNNIKYNKINTKNERSTPLS